jgi:hypothetical protein
MKAVIFFILAIISGLLAFYYMGMSVQSVDYHDGAYHHIPRERYALTFIISLIATVVFWKLGRRFSRPTGGAT